MSDARLRELERLAVGGDADAAAALAAWNRRHDYIDSTVVAKPRVFKATWSTQAVVDFVNDFGSGSVPTFLARGFRELWDYIDGRALKRARRKEAKRRRANRLARARIQRRKRRGRGG